MMNSTRLRVSLVIPAYNEESHLRACLDSVAAQSEAPFEVIVVDNNSTDQTAVIARQYSFVRVLRVPKQGIVFARNAGFNAARGEIIARIDADTTMESGWIARVRQQFEIKPDLAALTGLAWCPIVRDPRFGYSRYWMKMYLLWTSCYASVPILCGANLALRRSVWKQIRSSVCLDAALVHEDIDLSFLVAGVGGNVYEDPKLLIALDDVSYNSWPKFSAYMQQRWRTKAHHEQLGTLKRAKALGMTLPWWYRIGVIVAIALPGIPFMVISFCLDLPATLKATYISLQTRFANARSFLDMGDS